MSTTKRRRSEQRNQTASKKIDSKYVLRPRRSAKVPRTIKDGLKRKPSGGGLQCAQCGKYFKSLPELNVHYAVRKDHIKQKHPPKVKSFARRLKSIDKTLSDSDIEEAAVVYLAMKNPEKLKEAIEDELRRRFGR